MAVSTLIRSDISGIITNIRKRSAVIVEQHSNLIFNNLINLVDAARQRLILDFLSVPKPKFTKDKYIPNTSPYPRRDTGALIRSLSYRVTKNKIQYGYRRTNQIQFTIRAFWKHDPQPSTTKGNYPELLNSGYRSNGTRYKQFGFKDKLNQHMAEYLRGKIA